ncbi:DNA-binding HxlR family transcriptional regulator [Nocardioides salarius]|uniref:DNA-binding HxlR family transcriptional regulator n=1 Tax=Nocardioides salarius TaxID=374513 RepID=A0ABS2M7K4_9ACTN|nr:helix-turn-helix domain-containing protein [Nocardioides salarius]MBM7507173.1 DNA-binding HxlR family transcriptional regulator [Nocardioides salarius]
MSQGTDETTDRQVPPPASPAALAYSTENCTLGRTMAVLGERWCVVVLREVVNGVRRFDDIRRHSGIPRQVLSDRLSTLVDQDLLRREPYRVPGGRERHEYRLTTKGRDLYPALVALSAWGDRYLADPEGPPVEFAHRDCGARVRAVLECEQGHRLDTPHEVVPRPGPGVRPFAG